MKDLHYSGRSKWLVFLLCIFGGVLGLHRLYTGHFILAGVYAISGGFFLIGVVVDAFLILADIYEDSDGNNLV